MHTKIRCKYITKSVNGYGQNRIDIRLQIMWLANMMLKLSSKLANFSLMILAYC